MSCGLCGGKKGILFMKCADGELCNSCFRKIYKPGYGSIKDLTIKDIKRKVEEEDKNKVAYENFKVTKKVGEYFKIDESKKQWFIPYNILVRKIPKVYSFNDIVSFELIEDNDTHTFKRSVSVGLLSRKVIKNLCIKITLKDFDNPFTMIKLIDKSTNTNSIRYKMAFKDAQEIMSLLELISKQTDIYTNKKEEFEDEIKDNFIFCRKCGSKLLADSIFCNKCGEKL